MTTANNIKILTTKFLTHCGMVTNEFPKPYRILFAVSSLGLGHATRTLSIIKSYVEMEWQVSVISHGNALKFLQDELDDTKINFIELEDYPNIERGAGLDYFFYLVTDIFSTCRLIFKEQSFVRQRIEKRYDCIISDGRYGIYSSRIPSFIISHQISFVMPKGLGLFRFIADQVNRFFLNRFDKVFIPDFPENRLSLSGKLSHNRVTENLLHKWVGILSSYTSEEIKEEIDYLFIISGYLQEQRSSFTNNLIDQAKHLPGIKVFILGDTTLHEIIRLKEQNITELKFQSCPTTRNPKNLIIHE